MQDAQRFAAEAKAAGGSIRYMGDQSKYTEGAWHQLGSRGFWLNQIFFTIRRVVYGLTLGLVALGTAAIVTGLKFNAMLEQQQLAFKIFTGSLTGARKEVQFLFHLAATGPFEFTQVISGARQLQAFGFTVGETNKLLVSLQDAMAGMGLDQASLDRATLALGQIRSSGRLLGQDLRQLEQLGLVSPEDLARRLQIPQSALANIGQLNIPSKRAIDAIEAYWTEKFHGAAGQFQKTWTGELSTLRDYGRLLFGTMVQPLQDHLEQKTLPLVLKIQQAATQGFQAGGFEGMFAAIDKSLNNRTQFLLIWIRLRELMTPLLAIVGMITLDFLDAWRALGIGTKIMLPFIGLLQLVAWALRQINFILKPLIFLWVAEKSVIFALIIAKRGLVFWTLLTTAATKALRLAEIALLIWQWRSVIVTEYQITGIIILTAMQAKLISVLRKATIMWEILTAAMEANPFVALATAIILVVGGLVILYLKWKWFHDFVNSIARWILAHAYILALVPVIGPAIAVTVLLVQNFRTIIHWLSVVIDWVKKLVGWIGKIHMPHLHFPGAGALSSLNPANWLATGGDIVKGGYFGVGERGPEIVALPAGAAVRPVQSFPVGGMGANMPTFPEVVQLVSKLYLDRKQIGESVDEYRADRRARK